MTNRRIRKSSPSRRARLGSTLDELQKESFEYFLHEINPENGLVSDKTAAGWPASIAAVGFCLTSYPVVVERGFCKRSVALSRTLNCLRFFAGSTRGNRAAGYKGFYYHFLDMKTGRRVWNCEVSTIDTALLLAGVLTVAAYFDKNVPDEREVRELADILYQAVDWKWALGRKRTLSNGWKPESGFLKARWVGYSEALILYVLGLGSPSHPLPAESYSAWTDAFQWKNIYDLEFLYAGPLFIHQFSHVWLDLRKVQDAFMRSHGIDYFEKSRRATHVQRQYAIANPLRFEKYREHCWGITASDGPGELSRVIDGIERRFHDYIARGVPFGPDDGTLAPWAVVSSLPFAPDIVLPAIEYMNSLNLRIDNPYGFKATYNPTFVKTTGSVPFWVSRFHFGINQGPIIVMIENYRSEMMRELMRRCSYIVNGLKRAGFTGGWLERTP